MRLKARFVGLTSDEFTNKEDGKVIQYHRLLVLETPETGASAYKLLTLPISGENAKAVAADAVSFGDIVDIEVELVFDKRRNIDVLKCISWS